MQNEKRIEKNAIVLASRKLGGIIEAHKAGKPVIREMAERILAREKSRNSPKV